MADCIEMNSCLVNQCITGSWQHHSSNMTSVVLLFPLCSRLEAEEGKQNWNESHYEKQKFQINSHVFETECLLMLLVSVISSVYRSSIPQPLKHASRAECSVGSLGHTLGIMLNRWSGIKPGLYLHTRVAGTRWAFILCMRMLCGRRDFCRSFEIQLSGSMLLHRI